MIEKFLQGMKNAADSGVSGMANRIVVHSCDFFETGEGEGFVIRTFGHVMSINWSVYEISYIIDADYRRLYLSKNVLEDNISDGISDGEFLYYMHSDGNLRRIDKTGEIKTYPVFEEEENFYVRYLKIEAEGNEIIVTSIKTGLTDYKSIVVDVSY